MGNMQILVILLLVSVLALVVNNNQQNVADFIGILFDYADNKKIIPVNINDFKEDSTTAIRWYTTALNVFIVDNPSLSEEKRLAILNSIFSEEQTTYGGFLGWEGAINHLFQVYPDSTVPNRFQLIQNELLADIVIIATNDSPPEKDDGSKKTKGVATIYSTRNNEITNVVITLYEVDITPVSILESVSRHEVGHALGLEHNERFNDLMSPTIIFSVKTISNHNVEVLYQHYR